MKNIPAGSNTGFFNPNHFFCNGEVFLKSYSDIRDYLLQHYGTDNSRKFIIFQLDMNDRIIEESKFSNICDFKYVLLKLVQSFILNNTAKLIVVRISQPETDLVKPNDFKYSKTVRKLTKLLGIRLVDYIVMKANEIESFKYDHGSIE